MIGNLIAVLLIADIVLTVFAHIRYRQRPFPFVRLLVALLFAAIVLSVIFGAYVTPYRGGPVVILVITGLCCCISMLVPLAKPAWSLGIFLLTLTMAVGLPWLAADQHDYTFFGSTSTHISANLCFYLEELPEQDQSYPAGWLTDQPFAAKIPSRSLHGWINRPHPLWHSRITHMYRLETRKGEPWYPGGPLRDALPNITVRER